MTLTTGDKLVTLTCDTPGCGARKMARAEGRATPKHGAILRTAAADEGWCRFRSKTTAPLGDFCPACTRKLLEQAL